MTTNTEVEAILAASRPCRRCQRQVLLATEVYDYQELDRSLDIASVICADCFTPEEIADGEEAENFLRYVGEPL